MHEGFESTQISTVRVQVFNYFMKSRNDKEMLVLKLKQKRRESISKK
jgi:hypothetical protein